MSTLRIREWSDLENHKDINHDMRKDEFNLIDLTKHGRAILGSQNVVDQRIVNFYKVKQYRDDA